MSVLAQLRGYGLAALASLAIAFTMTAPVHAQTVDLTQRAQVTSASPAPPANTTAAGTEAYVLGTNDRVRITVFNETSLSGEFTIDGSGRAALPLIGEVQAAGITVQAFEDRIEDRLRHGYLNDPRVSVEVMNFRPFYIMGEVVRPNQYPYSSNLSVMNAVATAGGFTPLADQSRAFIRRAGSEMETQVTLTPEMLVQPGDTIRIGTGAFYILGEVNRPGAYPFTSGLTVLNAVATAQGFTYRANQGRVHIQRAGESESRAYRLTPDLRLQPGDTIRIGERFF